MNKLLLLVTASARSQLRWAKQHVYLWLILAPLVLGMTLFTASRVATNLPSWQPSRSLIILLAVLFEALLIGINLSRVTAELYHLRRPEAYFDALPIDSTAHLHAALITRLTRTSALAALGLIIHWRFGGGELFDSTALLALAGFIIVTSLAEIMAAMSWIHWGHTKDKQAATIAVIAFLLSATVGGALLGVAFKPDYSSSTLGALLAPACIIWAATLYFIIHRAHRRWRASDIEYAKRLQSPNRWSITSARAVRRRFSPTVAAQLARDLQLTLRAFSSAVYVTLAIAVLWIVILIVVLTTDSLPAAAIKPGFLEATWRVEVMAIKFVCVFVTASLGMMLPMLIVYELPTMWLEHAAGTTGLDMLQAKMWYTRIITMPAPVLAWAAGMLTGKAPLFYALPLLAECLMLWLVVSAIIGGLAFEIPNRPGLAIIIMATIGIAAGLYSSLLWLLGIIIYAQAKGSLVERGRHRAKYYLMTEGD